MLTAISCVAQDFGTYISATVIHATSQCYFIFIILLKFVLLAIYQRYNQSELLGCVGPCERSETKFSSLSLVRYFSQMCYNNGFVDR